MSGEAFKRLLKTLGFDESGNTLGGSSNSKKRSKAAEASPTGKKAKTLMSFGFKKEPVKGDADGSAEKVPKQALSQETT